MNALSHALVNVLPRDAFGELAQINEVDENENLAPAVQEVDRYLSTDRLVPSYHNVVTIAGIEVRTSIHHVDGSESGLTSDVYMCSSSSSSHLRH